MSDNRKAFFERYAALVIPEPNSGCWLWTGALSAWGYGRTARKYAHRLCFEITHAQTIAPGLEVRHSCDTKLCVNPDHLLLGTHGDNMRDIPARNRHRPRRGQDSTESPLTNEDVMDIRRRALAGEYTPALADEFGVTYQSIAAIVIGKTWAHLPVLQTKIGRMRGDRHYNAVLSSSGVQEIKILLAGETLTHKAIASRFGVARCTIGAIANNRNWNHV